MCALGQALYAARAHTGFCNIKQLGVFYSFLSHGMLSLSIRLFFLAG